MTKKKGIPHDFRHLWLASVLISSLSGTAAMAQTPPQNNNDSLSIAAVRGNSFEEILQLVSPNMRGMFQCLNNGDIGGFSNAICNQPAMRPASHFREAQAQLENRYEQETESFLNRLRTGTGLSSDEQNIASIYNWWMNACREVENATTANLPRYLLHLGEWRSILTCTSVCEVCESAVFAAIY